jgi:hypothetical protein
VGEGSTAAGAGGSVGVAGGVLLQAARMTARKRITSFFMLTLLVEWIKKFYITFSNLSIQKYFTGLKSGTNFLPNPSPCVHAKQIRH